MTDDLLPQWYRAGRDILDTLGHDALAHAARRRWPDAPLRVDTQSIELGVGAALGVPTWQQASWADGGALLLHLAHEPLLQVQPPGGPVRQVPPGEVVALGPTDRLRFLPANHRQPTSLALLRPATSNLRPPRPRLCARVFHRTHVPPDLGPGIDPLALPRLRFDSRATTLHTFPPSTTDEVANEPVFRACARDMAREAGGPLMRRFLDALPPDWRDPDADVRVGAVRDELSPGWTPCAVGFHMDGTSRGAMRPDGMADLTVPGRVDQLIACFGPGAPTRFILGPVELPEPPLGEFARAVQARWSNLLEAGADDPDHPLRRWTAPPDTLVHFGFGDFHTGSVSERPGWRCFIKAMRNRGDPFPERPAPVTSNAVSWPINAESFPTDPCGVFPDDVP